MRKLNKLGEAVLFTIIFTTSVVLVVLDIKDRINDIEELEGKIELKQEQIEDLKENDINMKSLIKSMELDNSQLIEENEKLSEEVNELKEKVDDYKNYFRMEATAYTSFCNTGCIGITATGYNVKNTITYKGMRIVAVDPSVIPLYSEVMVYPKNGEPFKAIALDTGGDIKGNRIDVLTGTTSKNEAWNFGRQEVTVRVLNWG